MNPGWFLLPARTLLAKVRRARAVLTMNTWVLRGKERTSGEDFCFSFSGSEALKAYQARICLAEGYQEIALGNRFVPILSRILKFRFPECAVSFFEIDQDRAPATRFVKTDLRVPVWMPTEIEIKDSLEASLTSTQFKMITRKIRSNRLEFDVKTDAASFDDFYYKMYLPFIANRHGKTAEVTNYETLMSRYPFCELVMVKRDGQYLGGYLVDFSQKKPRFLEMGIRDGSDEYMKWGVPGAAYFFSFQRVLERGGAIAGLGTSHGFLNDGSLQYKLSLGASFSSRHYEKAGLLHLRFLKPAPGLQAFLTTNPFITMGKNGDYSASFFAKGLESVTPSMGDDFARYRQKKLRPRLYIFEQSEKIAAARPDLAKMLGECAVSPAGDFFAGRR